MRMDETRVVAAVWARMESSVDGKAGREDGAGGRGGREVRGRVGCVARGPFKVFGGRCGVPCESGTRGGRNGSLSGRRGVGAGEGVENGEGEAEDGEGCGWDDEEEMDADC